MFNVCGSIATLGSRMAEETAHALLPVALIALGALIVLAVLIS